MAEESIKVSVIVPCYNAEKSVEACLKGLLSQEYANFEIIVVDDNSQDGTTEVLKRISGIKVIKNNENHGPAYSRNVAIKESTGDILLLIDSDSVVEQKDLIQKHVLAHKDPAHHIIGGGVKGFGAGVVARADNYSHWFLNIPYSNDKVGTHIVTNNMSIKREVFESQGGFNEALRTGEDTDFCERARKAGYNIALKTDAVIMHHDREKLDDFLNNFYLVGKDRVPVRRLSKHRYWFLLPFGLVSSVIYSLPLALLLSLQVVFAWFRYDKWVVLSFPIIFAGRMAMTIGIVSYYFDKSFRKKAVKICY